MFQLKSPIKMRQDKSRVDDWKNKFCKIALSNELTYLPTIHTIVYSIEK